MSFVGDVMQGVGAIGAGQSARSAAVARKQELDNEAQLQTIAANESQTTRLMDLNRTLGNVQAFIGGRGLNPNSPSAMAIQSSISDVADTDTQRTAFNAKQQAASLRLAGRAAAASGEAAATTGFLKGFGSFFQAANDPLGGGGKSAAGFAGL